MGNRYRDKTIFRNQDESYSEVFEQRHVRHIRQYGTSKLRVPTINQMQGLSRTQHIWKVGDHFYKLALQYYKRSEYWWVIALYNQRPTESHVQAGDILIIPQPLDAVLRVMRP